MLLSRMIPDGLKHTLGIVMLPFQSSKLNRMWLKQATCER